MSWLQSDLQKVEQPYVPPSWTDGTDAEIVEALEKHYASEIDLTQYWSVGDERVVHLDAIPQQTYIPQQPEQYVVLVLSHLGGKYLADGVTECLFQVDQKNCLYDTAQMNASSTNQNGWSQCMLRGWLDYYYLALPETLKPIFKQFINQSGKGNGSTSGVNNTTDIFALRAEAEVIILRNYSVSGEGSQVDWYKTSANQYKWRADGSSKQGWWTRSAQSGNKTNFCIRPGTGSSQYASATSIMGIAPFGVI